MRAEFWLRRLKVTEHSEDLGVDGVNIKLLPREIE
jgi:hypothetical protein